MELEWMNGLSLANLGTYGLGEEKLSRTGGL